MNIVKTNPCHNLKSMNGVYNWTYTRGAYISGWISYRTFKTHPKHIFPQSKKKGPLKHFFMLSFLIFHHVFFFQNLWPWPKTQPFLPILHVFVPINDVCTYTAWSWKSTLITWIFLWGWYPTSNASGPPSRYLLLPIRKLPYLVLKTQCHISIP